MFRMMCVCVSFYALNGCVPEWCIGKYTLSIMAKSVIQVCLKGIPKFTSSRNEFTEWWTLTVGILIFLYVGILIFLHVGILIFLYCRSVLQQFFILCSHSFPLHWKPYISSPTWRRALMHHHHLKVVKHERWISHLSPTTHFKIVCINMLICVCALSRDRE